MSKTVQEWLDEGRSYVDQNQPEEARKCYNEALALDPQSGEAYYLIGRIESTFYGNKAKAIENFDKAIEYGYDAHEIRGDCLTRLGRTEEAIVSFKKSLELRPDKTFWAYVGSLLEDLGRIDEAEEMYDEGLQRTPTQVQANYFKANLLAKQGRREEALKYYETHMNDTPPLCGFTFNAANNYLAMGQKDKAMELYKRAHNMNPESAMNFYNRGRCYMILGEKEKAIEDFKKAQELLETNHTTSYAPGYVNLMKNSLSLVIDTDKAVQKAEEAVLTLERSNSHNPESVINLKKLQGQMQDIESELMKQVDNKEMDQAKGNIDKLEQMKVEFNKQLAEMQNPPQEKQVEVKPQKTKNQWVSEGRGFADQKKPDEAERCYKEALALDPHYGEAWYFLGRVNSTFRGDKVKAIECFDKAIEFGYNAHEIRGDCLTRLGRTEEAIMSFKRALELRPELTFWAYVGSLLEDLGRIDEAEEMYDEGLKRFPNQVQANYFKANLLAKQGRREEALKYYQTHMNDTPPLCGFTFNAANNFLAMGQKDKAMELYKRAYDMSPETAMNFYNRGRCFMILGEKDKAIEDFKKAQELLETNHTTSYAPGYVKLMTNSLSLVIDTDKTVQKAEEAMLTLERNNSHNQESINNLKKLQVQMQDIETELMKQVDNKEITEAKGNIDKLEQIKGELNKQIAEIQNQPDPVDDEEEEEEIQPQKDKTEWLSEGRNYADEKEPDEAERCYKEALALDPHYGEAWYFLGRVNSTFRGDKVKAIECFDKAIECGYNAHEIRGDCLTRLGRTEEAIVSFKKALELRPELTFWAYVGSLLEDLGRIDEAEEMYDEGLQRTPNQVQANYFKANLLAKQGRREEALKYYETHMNDTPPLCGFTFNAANNFMAMGHKDKAMELYKRADKMKPETAMNFYNRGRCFMILGDKDKAIEDFKKAQELLETNHTTSFAPVYVDLMKNSLSLVIDTDEAVQKAEEAVLTLERSDSHNTESVLNLKKLQGQMQDIESQLMKQVDNKEMIEAKGNIDKLGQIKVEFDKQLAEIQKQPNKSEENER